MALFSSYKTSNLGKKENYVLRMDSYKHRSDCDKNQDLFSFGVRSPLKPGAKSFHLYLQHLTQARHTGGTQDIVLFIRYCGWYLQFELLKCNC